MKYHLKFWQVDSFTNEPFKGNPAAVFVLHEEIPDSLMQNIAVEMNLSETAFLLFRKEKKPTLRWFTPVVEVDLCGHATLAAAHIYFTELYPDFSEMTFDTKFVGPLTVKKKENKYTMNFPSRPGEQVDPKNISSFILEGLGIKVMPIGAYKSRDMMLVFDSDQVIKDIRPDFNTLAKYEDAIIVTAPSSGESYDFISRFFCANDGIPEDPVTGSAHCTLAPYWAGRMKKNSMKAYQASIRGGCLDLEICGDRVLISGEAITIIEGTMRI